MLKPKNDIVFQSLFNKSNENITKNFVESLLEEKVYKIRINEEKELYRENPEEKLGILDLELDVNDNEKVDVEIQLINKNNFVDRLLYYFSKLYASTVNIGKEYKESKRVVIIAILDYEFEKTKEIEEMETKWKIMCRKHPELELTNKMEIHIIELSKMRKSYYKNKEDKKSQWLMFIDDPNSKEVKEIMEKNEEIKEAIIEVHKMSEEEKIQRLADLREKARMDETAIRDYGIEKGRKEGRKEGEKNKSIEIARKMKLKNIPLEQIIEMTGLTKEEIEKL